MDFAVLQRKHTRLEIVAPDEVGAVLEYKAQELQEKDLPVEAGLADYIAFGLQNVEDEIEKLKAYKKAIDEKIKDMQEQKTQVSEKIAEWLEGNGIDKLKGTFVSSVTIKSENKNIRKKFILDADRETLVEAGFAHYEDVEVVTPKQVKINKKRKKDEQRIEYLSETK